METRGTFGQQKRAREAVNRHTGECESSACLRKGESREEEELRSSSRTLGKAANSELPPLSSHL